MVYKNNIDPVQKRYWPGTKAILTQYKNDTDQVQKRYWPGTKAIPFDTVHSTVTQRVCTGSTGTRYKSGTGIRYRNVYRNGVQDVYRKVPYWYLVPYTTIPNRYHLPPLNSTGTVPIDTGIFTGLSSRNSMISIYQRSARTNEGKTTLI